jgi:hypothetical protein
MVKKENIFVPFYSTLGAALIIMYISMTILCSQALRRLASNGYFKKVFKQEYKGRWKQCEQVGQFFAY